ncbi:hypothetical protein KQI74_03710 [Paenibacillus barcinonensis]|uniref:hypothetical protein n=1 Tax=Paenibacillus barcinonensis TaxID=198119 RepID=UPI001C0FEB16|nr:hypothetical protein [Paenibacillus barcinonensis]MBU5351372.1 hypothetical protein [Paenibacillus barcinonensis]
MNNKWIVNNYLEYIREHYPIYHEKMSDETLNQLKDLYFSVNDIFVMCNIFDKSEYIEKNFYSLICEFKSYASRLLLIIPINDKYLVDSLLRLLIEKLYRMIYAHHNAHLLESSIRNHERRKMSTRLTGKLNKKEELDILYGDYSELIHHSSPTTTDLLNFRKLGEVDVGLVRYINDQVEMIKEIFMLDFFIPKVKVNHIELASKLTLKGQLKEHTSKLLEEECVI